MADNSDPCKESEDSTQLPYSADEKQLVAEAYAAFADSQFENCLAALKKLMAKRSEDPKLSNNRSIAEYHRSHLIRTEEFKQQLQHAASLAKLSLDQPDRIGGAEQAIILYNYSVMLFYQRQYSQVVKNLECIQRNLDSTDETFTRRHLFLHLEVLLKLQRPEDMLNICAVWENQMPLISSQSMESASSRDGSTGDLASGYALPNSSGISTGTSGSTETISYDKFRSEVQLFKVKALLMSRAFKAAKKELKVLRNVGFVNYAIQFVRAHFEYLKSNPRKALKVFSQIPQSLRSPVDTGECETVMHWNNLGCLHFHMGKHNLGAMYFRRAMRENDKVCEEFQQSKKGNGHKTGHMMHHHHHHHHHQTPLKAFSLSRHLEILYNLGVELLFAGKPTVAFDYLLEVVNVFPRNPRLWFRLTECCIKTYRPNNDFERQLDMRLRFVQRVVGTGMYRKIILGSGIMEVKKPWEEAAAMPTPTLEFGSLCVRNALLLLPRETNTTATQAGESLEAKQARILEWAEKQCVSVQPGGFLRGADIIQLKSSILVSGAYIALCLNHYTDAVDLAGHLLAQPLLSGAHRYLGRMYLAEALVNMDKIHGAIELLQPDRIDNVALTTTAPTPPAPAHEDAGCPMLGGDVGTGGEGSCDESSSGGGSHAAGGGGVMSGGAHSHTLTHPGDDTWQPANVNKARGIMFYNLAATLAIQGDYERARKVFNDCTNSLSTKQCPPPAHYYFLRIYLDLMQGRRSAALRFIRERFGHIGQPGATPAPNMLQMAADANRVMAQKMDSKENMM